MADDKTKRGPTDARRVNPSEDYEVRYWSEKWGVPPEKLKAAVEKVGPMAVDVARELGRQVMSRGHRHGPFSPDRVDLKEAWDVRCWCRRWHCTPAELREKVARVGNDPDALDRAFATDPREMSAPATASDATRSEFQSNLRRN